MEITSIKVKREEREGSHMKGRASVVIDNGQNCTNEAAGTFS